MKHPYVLSLLILFICSCSEQVEQNRTVTNPYPGNPSEDFSPKMVKDPSYKNLALHRRAYASSSWDYNLTAQLATDGIIDEKGPAYFILSTSSGLVPRNEREWMFDMKVNTGCKLQGTNDYFQLDMVNYCLQFDSILVSCRIKPNEKPKKYYGVPGQEEGAIDPVAINRIINDITWSVSLLGSTDGKMWQTLDSIEGRGGKIFRVLSKSGQYNHYRLAFSSDKAGEWEISDWDFFCSGSKIKRVYNCRMESHFRDIMRPVTPPFTSFWMSGNDHDQWIYVDLGTEASIENVKTHWAGNTPSGGSLLVSNDAENWKEVAPISSEIKCSEKARFVKLALNSGGPYVLSEIEVFGTDGVAAKAKDAPVPGDRRLDLAGGNWKVQRASQVSDDGNVLSKNGYDDSDWIVATVPATVLSSYINAGIVPDPNYSDNQLQISDSYFMSDFWYRDTFILPESFEGKNIFLNFDGINWKAEIYLNGLPVGNVDGAFIHGQFNVDKYLHEGVNCLAVKVLKTPLSGCVKEQTRKSTDSNGGIIGAYNPTFHASMGWDWIPTIRGRNIGIWNDVYLTAMGNVRIYDPYVKTKLNLPDTTSATIYIETKLNNITEKNLQGTLSGNFGDYNFSKDISLSAGETKLIRIDSIIISNPKLWWPVGYGKPNLYDTKIAFYVDNIESDRVELKCGIRQMTYAMDSVGALNLYINGRRFIGRGGNWGLSESNLSYRAREYDAAVKYHADMNFTMIRDWVGQIADEEFYEACDRYGVTIWQDFWLANPWDGPDPYDEKLFMDNAVDYIKRIRNHPSIALYCGRNEAMPPLTLDSTLRALVAAEHPEIFYISHSAAGVVSGGGPYRALPVESYFNPNNSDRLHSERGMPCVMNYESLANTIEGSKLFPQTSLWGLHDFTLESAQYCNSFNELLTKGFGEINDIHTYCKYAQWINYNGYRAMFEGRSKYRQGLILWMSHPCWPSLVWQTYDYFFEPTAAYFGAKKACEPLHIQYNPLTKKVEVVNMSGGNRDALLVKASIFNLYGKKVWEDKSTIVSNDDSTNECMTIIVPSDITEVYFIKLELYDGEKLVSDNFYWQGRENGNYQAVRQLPDPQLDVNTTYHKGDSWTAVTTIKNCSETPALMLRVKLIDDDGKLVLPVIYSENYFSLMPRESKIVTTTFSSFDIKDRKPTIILE